MVGEAHPTNSCQAERFGFAQHQICQSDQDFLNSSAHKKSIFDNKTHQLPVKTPLIEIILAFELVFEIFLVEKMQLLDANIHYQRI